MIITGYATDEKGIQYKNNFLLNGQKQIKKFPHLYKIVGNFPKFKKESYDSNIILNCASMSKYDISSRGPNSEMLSRLKNYENLIKDIKLNLIKKEKRNNIIKKLNSFDSQQSLSIIKELEFLSQLKNHKKISNVRYENFQDGHHDFRFKVEDIIFNLEFASPGEGKVSQIIKESFDKTAERILKKIPDNHILKLYVQTDSLLNKDMKMENSKIIDFLTKSMLDILPLILVKVDRATVRFWWNMGNSDERLLDKRHLFKRYDEFGERLELLTKTKKGLKYLNGKKFGSFDNFPIESFRYQKGNFKIVVIDSISMHPSTSEGLRQKYILGRLKSLIKEKLKKEQLKGQENPIIALQFQDIMFMGYTKDEAVIIENNTEKIKKTVIEAFTEIKNKEILGIILIEDFLSNSIFINNPNVKGEPSMMEAINFFSRVV